MVLDRVSGRNDEGAGTVITVGVGTIVEVGVSCNTGLVGIGEGLASKAGVAVTEAVFFIATTRCNQETKAYGG